MGQIIVALRSPPHSALDIEVPEGVGRLDHCAMPDKVREDAVELMAVSLAGSPQVSPDPLVSWLLGPKMLDWDDPRRMLVARYMARSAWEFAVESCSGFALGVKDEDGQLGGLALAMPRSPSDCITQNIERQTAKFMAGKVPWNNLGDAKTGVNARLKSFEKMRRVFMSRMTNSHVYLSHLRVNSRDHSQEKAENLELRLATAVNQYADTRGLPVYTLTAGTDQLRLFEQERVGFTQNDRVQVDGATDPDKLLNTGSNAELLFLSRTPQKAIRHRTVQNADFAASPYGNRISGNSTG